MAYFKLDNTNTTFIISEDGLTATYTTGSWDAARTFETIPSGKWYWECTLVEVYSGEIMVGIAKEGELLTSYLGDTIAGCSYYPLDGAIYNSTPYARAETINSPPDNTILGFAFDTATGDLWLSINGSWQYDGDPANGTGSIYNLGAAQEDLWYIGPSALSVTSIFKFNFGQSAFVCKVPEGFNAGVWRNSISPLTFSVTPGTYSSNQTLAVTSAVSGTIYYKDGGSSFTTSGTSFTDTSYSGIQTITAYGGAYYSLDYSKFIDSSISTIGTSTYLLVDDDPSIDFGGDDFTLECWIYRTALPVGVDEDIFSKRSSPAVYGGILFVLSTTGYPRLLVTLGSIWDMNVTGSVGIQVNTWNHFAIVRNGDNWKVYVNGQESISETLAGTVGNSSGQPLGISTTAATNDVTYNFEGYIDEVRFSKVVRYTGNFTPQTEPFTLSSGIDIYTTLLIQAPTLISGTEYTGPITLSGTHNFEFCSTASGLGASWPQTKNYIVDTSFNASEWEGTLNFSIDATKVDEELTDFPLKITLSSGTGINNFDTTSIFDNLTTTSTGTHDMYTRYYQNRGTLDNVDARGYTLYGPQVTTETGTGTYPSVLKFNGTSDYILADKFTDLTLGTDDFSIDLWMHSSNQTADTNDRRVLCLATNNSNLAIQLAIDPSVGSVEPYWSTGYKINSTTDICDGNWHHIALTRVSDDIELYYDGIFQDDRVLSSTDFVTNSLTIGKYYAGAGHFDGYMTGIRLQVGSVYPTISGGAFTPPAGPEPILSDTKVYITGEEEPTPATHISTYNDVAISGTAGKFDNGAYFNGTSSNIQVSESPEDFDFEGGNFTIDYWEYCISRTHAGASICRHNTTNPYGFLFYDSSGDRAFYMGSSWNIASNKILGSVDLSKWTHFAVCREGNNFYGFKNGTLTNTWQSSNSAPTSENAFSIGRYNSTQYFHGYFSDIRLSKGIARWTSSFTPPKRSYNGIQYTPNNKKIAVTAVVSGVERQLPVEIAFWSEDDERAELWTKAPTVSGALDTVIRLYYNVDKDDNTNFVGSVTSDPAKSIWKDSYNSVFHCSDFLSHDVASGFLDSASSLKAPTTVGAISIRDNLIDKHSISLDGASEYINFVRTPLTVTNQDWSITARIKPVSSTNIHEGYVVIQGEGLVQSNGYWSVLGEDDVKQTGSTAVTVDGNYHLLTATKSGTDYSIRLDGTDITSAPISDLAWGLSSTAAPFRRIGEGKTSIRPSIELDEVFISDVVKSPAWESALYYNLDNNFFTVSSGTIPDPHAFYVDGYVQVDSIAAQKKVLLYRRSDGVLVNTTLSNPDTGYFTVGGTTDEPHFLIILSDFEDAYNLLSYDKIDSGA